jgi:hypothetical protein
MTVVDLKVPKRAKRSLPLDQASGAARFFGRMVGEIESDLGGHRMLSRIQRELLHAFAGAATQIQYLNHQVLIGCPDGGLLLLGSSVYRKRGYMFRSQNAVYVMPGCGGRSRTPKSVQLSTTSSGTKSLKSSRQMFKYSARAFGASSANARSTTRCCSFGSSPMTVRTKLHLRCRRCRTAS